MNISFALLMSAVCAAAVCGCTKPMDRPVTAAADFDSASYRTEERAKQACGDDNVVWGNSNTHIYHLPGMPYYGRTTYGGYMCRKEAEAQLYQLSKIGER